MTGPEMVLRSTGARVAAWVWLVFAALNLLDVALRGRDAAAAVAAAALLLGCGIAYVLGLRPRIEAGEHGLRLRNPLRDIDAPWPAVRKIEATHAVVLHYTGADGAERTARAWVLQTSPRAAARQKRHTRDAALKDRTPTTYAVEQLNEVAARHRGGPEPGAGTGTARWSRSAVAALAVPAALLAVAVAFAVG
ncbi:PH domain-containing protein [Actinomadura craniellae]|uniref:PH domain-containing protein n=1 Tax=Actinomadura craniellae TaxID=2231787 RepID=A0A365H949_9ACTN|nr:PH domain-containing protein [Actinomadura craniellae]RAY15625.1 PH domain-containing protein [Actinomadura craniellae]